MEQQQSHNRAINKASTVHSAKHRNQPNSKKKPSNPVTPPQNEDGVPQDPKQESSNNKNTTTNPARGFRLVEWASVVINAVLAIIAARALIVYGGQLHVMSGQLAEMKTEFSVSHRPWVSVESGQIRSNGMVRFDRQGGHISLSYTLKNGGTAPAIGTWVQTRLISRRMPTTKDDARIIINCGPDGNQPTDTVNSNVFGTLMLPNDTRQNGDGATLVDKPSSDTEILLPVCIRYKDENGGLHATGLIWLFRSFYKSRDGIIPGSTLQGQFVQLGIGNFSY